MNAEIFINDIPLAAGHAAHAGTSFTPEVRARQERDGYAQTMAADYAQLLKCTTGKPEMLPVLEVEFARYREGYRARTLKHLASRSRCMSSMITGPSNFPTRRNEKRFAVEHKRLEELIEFRNRALAAITKTLCPELRPIMAGDGDAVERLHEKILEAQQQQELMKAVNAAHKAFLKDPATLDAAPFSDKLKQTVRTYKPEYSWTPHPFAPFELTNNNANIRRMQERLNHLTRMKAIKPVEVEGEHARVEDCPADNRVRLFFPGKPDADVRTRLKSSGFRWTPSLGCWQAYRNDRTIDIAKREAGLQEVAA